MPKILVVDDEENICELIAYNLKKEGYDVAVAHDGVSALKALEGSEFELIVLDVMLPQLNGIEVCKRVRGNPKFAFMPIIMLSAKGEEIDKVLGLEFGADDYVTKPFSPRELVARVKAVLRRTSKDKKEDESEGVIYGGGITINPHTREVAVNREIIDLTPKEYALLELLMKNEGRAFSREYLLEKIWGYDYLGDTRTVDVHIRHLRQKIGDDTGETAHIQTVRGFGYRFKGRN
jgi:two-component system alkaline phosphatase synthesis response regulator PhoP